jgi:hypothetical protein
MAPGGTIHGFLQNEIGRIIGNHSSRIAPDA